MATKFSREYKLECVELVSKHGYGVKEAAAISRTLIF